VCLYVCTIHIILIYRTIQNKRLSLVKYHILDLRRFFLYENFVRSFQITRRQVDRIVSESYRGDEQRRSRLDTSALCAERILIGRIRKISIYKILFFFFSTYFSPLLLSLCLSHTSNMLILLNYKLE